MRPAWVTGLGLWSPGFAAPEPWFDGTVPDPAVVAPSCEAVSSRLRRGTSLVTRIGLEVMGQAARRGGADLSRAAMIFGSAHGEVRTAFEQFRMMEEPGGRLSPVRFKSSVHNTATGLLSIAFENRGFSTALAAGGATFAMCLLEGLALLDRQGGEAVIGLADDVLEEPFCQGPVYRPLGVALSLAAERPDRGALAQLADFGYGEPLAEVRLAEDVRHNPTAAGLPLLEAVCRGRTERVPLELEAEIPYSIKVISEGPR